MELFARFVGRVLRSGCALVLCGLAGVLAIPYVGAQGMEARAGHRHGLVGIPIDAHTRVVPPDGKQGIRAAAVSNWVVNYTGFTPQAQAAFQRAVTIWSGLVNSPVPIVVNANFAPTPGFLAFGGFSSAYRDFSGAPLSGIWYPVPIANARVGFDLDPGIADIDVTFDSSTSNWYFGLDGNTPAGRYDFVSVALHELAHGLGFAGSMDVVDEFGSWGGGAPFPYIYDHHTANRSGIGLTNTLFFENPSTELAAELQSNNVFWSGAAGTAGNAGVRPKLYAPDPWVPGSSHVHLDEAAYPAGDANSLMTYAINSAEAIHSPGPIGLGIMSDIGWSTDLPCSYSTTTQSVSVGSDGIMNATIGVQVASGCTWTAVSNNPEFITITGGASGNGNGVFRYTVSPNGVSYRSGSISIAGLTIGIVQFGTGPSMSLDKTRLNFGAVWGIPTFVVQTSAQPLRLSQTGAGTVTWTVTSSDPSWLHVSPSSGTGPATLSISVTRPNGVLFNDLTAGTITFSFTGAGAVPESVRVLLTTRGTSEPPIGTVDTPIDNRTGVTGAIPFTGWALDDIEIDRIAICRAAVGGESVPLSPDCAGTLQVFLGFAIFIDGARPDVQAAYEFLPRSSRGGWGFMVLTNMLPNQGNGTYVFNMWAKDREGHTFLLGTRTMTCANASATKPFGAIDTPTQGGTASGTAFINFGWALTQQPKIIPIDGSTITVLIDGAPIGNATYNNFRSDIATLFPGLQNSNGAVGYRFIDTTTLANGLHTIAWVVVDSAGIGEGIGSRYFTVSNTSSAMTSAISRESVRSAPQDASAIAGRRGWDLGTPWTAYASRGAGRTLVRGEELDRFELALGAHPAERHSGFLRAGQELLPLPAGSNLDAKTGAFTWAPGVGFVGTYDLVFVRTRGRIVVGRRDVRFVIAPKGRGLVGPQVVIDAPRVSEFVAQPFTIGGWAADLDVPAGTGVSGLHAWAYPLSGGPPVFLGAASYGGARADVAAVHGERFRDSGFGLIAQGLTHGDYDLAVFAWSTEKSDFIPARVVRITVR